MWQDLPYRQMEKGGLHLGQQHQGELLLQYITLYPCLGAEWWTCFATLYTAITSLFCMRQPKGECAQSQIAITQTAACRVFDGSIVA